MQSNTGLSRWLKVPFLYNMFQAAIGGNALRRRLIQNHLRAKPGDKVIDIGCGPAPALECLPDVQYLGLDTNPGYCVRQGTHRHKGTFVVGGTQPLRGDSRFKMPIL